MCSAGVAADHEQADTAAPKQWSGMASTISYPGPRVLSNLLPPIMFGPLIDAPPSQSSQHSHTCLVDMTFTFQLICSFLQLRDRCAGISNAVQECGGPSWWYACYTVLHWLHCKADEEFRTRSVRGCSIVGLTGKYCKGNITIITIITFTNWKSWGAFRGVSAALLTGLKTFEQSEQYLDIACLHPTGWHWVNNFVTKKKKPPKSWPYLQRLQTFCSMC